MTDISFQYKYGRLSKDYFNPNMYHVIFEDYAIVLHVDQFIALFCEADFCICEDYNYDSRRHHTVCSTTLDALLTSDKTMLMVMLDTQTNRLSLNANIQQQLVLTYHQIMLFEYRNAINHKRSYLTDKSRAAMSFSTSEETENDYVPHTLAPIIPDEIEKEKVLTNEQHQPHDLAREQNNSINTKKRVKEFVPTGSFIIKRDMREILGMPFGRWNSSTFTKFIIGRSQIMELVEKLPTVYNIKDQKKNITENLNKISNKSFAMFALTFYLLEKKFPKQVDEIIRTVTSVYNYPKSKYLDCKTHISYLRSFATCFIFNHTRDNTSFTWLAGLSPPNNVQDYTGIRRDMKKYEPHEYAKFFKTITIDSIEYMVPDCDSL
jgi:hypothetical protein